MSEKTEDSAVPRRFRLYVGDAERLPISVVRSPQLSVASLATQAAIKRMRLPTRRTLYAPKAVVGALRPEAAFALGPIARSDLELLPDLTTPIHATRDVGMQEQLDCLRDSAESDLVADIASQYGETPRDWLPVVDQPRRWLDSMAQASIDTWHAMEPLWRRNQGLISREIARVGTAQVRGGVAALLNSLPSYQYTDGWLVTSVPVDLAFDLGDRQLVLAPMISGPKASILNFELPHVAVIGYPVPGFGAGIDAEGADALVEVLGPLRARILRAATCPMTAGALALLVQIAPNTVSYHCTHLERAGLLSRERQGKAVLVSITDRGRELIDLMSD